MKSEDYMAFYPNKNAHNAAIRVTMITDATKYAANRRILQSGLVLAVCVASCDSGATMRDFKGIVKSNQVVNSATIRHGIDTIKIYEIKGGVETRSKLTNLFKLKKSVDDVEFDSFLGTDSPPWWRHDEDGECEMFLNVDSDRERYWNLWFFPSTETIFLEIGDW